jgi:hypothetical protein
MPWRCDDDEKNVAGKPPMVESRGKNGDKWWLNMVYA